MSNPSFELDTASSGGEVQAPPAGWTAFNEGGPADIGSEKASGSDYTVYNPLVPPVAGSQFCCLNMFNPSVTGGICPSQGASLFRLKIP